ncbi:MAG: hypothetical protein JWL84_3212 [Rhodospirillales bacterium]|jgi:hypothetical protein|nr:hypothetical protein [Rhodospirillales bacterium]
MSAIIIDPLTAVGVVLATAATDAVYVMFTSAVANRRRVPAATWSSIWYLLSSFAVISYTNNWVYVCFAAAESWLGAFASITFLHRPPGGPPVGAAPITRSWRLRPRRCRWQQAHSTPRVLLRTPCSTSSAIRCPSSTPR